MWFSGIAIGSAIFVASLVIALVIYLCVLRHKKEEEDHAIDQLLSRQTLLSLSPLTANSQPLGGHMFTPAESDVIQRAQARASMREQAQQAAYNSNQRSLPSARAVSPATSVRFDGVPHPTPSTVSLPQRDWPIGPTPGAAFGHGY